MHLFNENSSLCIVPKEYRRYKNILDLDGDGVVTEEEIQKAKQLLSKVDQNKNEGEMLNTMNDFKMSV